jgi:hypothetical protein
MTTLDMTLDLILIVIVLISQYNMCVLGYSPPFQRVHEGVMNQTVHYLDSTSYTSDGRTLSATIWLHSPVYNNQPYHGLRYGIKISLYNDTGTPYDLYIQQQTNRSWTTNAVKC